MMTATLRLWKDFYPRPPRGGRLTVPAPESFKDEFLSTPSARRATTSMAAAVRPRSFLSTPSARRATITDRAVRYLQTISIHALREEGDHLPRSWHLAAANFYPRPPRGGRPSRQTKMVSALRFLSTPSARRATRAFHSTVPGLRYFYPRPPRGGRRGVCRSPSGHGNFYPRPPRGGRLFQQVKLLYLIHFYPRPPRGGRPPPFVLSLLF